MTQSIAWGQQWQGKLCYAYGTSLTSESWGRYIPFLAELSGLRIVNCGIPAEGLTDLGGCSTGRVRAAVMSMEDGKQDADLILLEVGANEGGPIGDVFDTGTDTFCGCLNRCLRYLLEHTHAQLAVYPSTVTVTRPEESRDYYERQMKAEQICKINRVSFLGYGEGLGQARIAQGGAFVWDNVHQTELGGLNWARYLWSRLKDIPPLIRTLP